MTEKDLHIDYKNSTGNYVPTGTYGISEEWLEYVKWLEQKVIESTPHMIKGIMHGKDIARIVTTEKRRGT